MTKIKLEKDYHVQTVGLQQAIRSLEKHIP